VFERRGQKICSISHLKGARIFTVRGVQVYCTHGAYGESVFTESYCIQTVLGDYDQRYHNNHIC